MDSAEQHREAVRQADRLVTLALNGDGTGMGHDLRGATRIELVRTVSALAMRMAIVLDGAAAVDGLTGSELWSAMLADPGWRDLVPESRD